MSKDWVRMLAAVVDVKLTHLRVMLICYKVLAVTSFCNVCGHSVCNREKSRYCPKSNRSVEKFGVDKSSLTTRDVNSFDFQSNLG
jgi:hypothetical protein